ncbi:MAG TPA: serine/threonine-protein kinase [Vicinamibacterales bacterium]|nr:serine/threonine-protein kinase [Vicinamibacterales bacterium]
MSTNNSHPSRVGRYVIAEPIGRGTLGEVYAGVEDHVGRRVAVRVGTIGDLRVHQQARVTGQVAHPNVVSVLDLGEDQGHPFVAMELLDGASLDGGGAVTLRSLDARLQAMEQVCTGLQAAHERGIVHGHIKPSHVFVTRDGVVKLLDFGAGDGRPDAYAAPEQVAGEGASERSDVFSAAAVFHFMLTGRQPFNSNAAVRTDPPPAIGEAAAPEALSRTLLKALDKNPARRHQSINHLRAEIEQVRVSRQGDRDRVLKAARDRFRDIELLLAERRALGRRLAIESADREYDQALARLSSAFPEFARGDAGAVQFSDAARAAEALARLQLWHNEVLAAVSVLKSTAGVRK